VAALEYTYFILFQSFVLLFVDLSSICLRFCTLGLHLRCGSSLLGAVAAVCSWGGRILLTVCFLLFFYFAALIILWKASHRQFGFALSCSSLKGGGKQWKASHRLLKMNTQNVSGTAMSQTPAKTQPQSFWRNSNGGAFKSKGKVSESQLLFLSQTIHQDCDLKSANCAETQQKHQSDFKLRQFQLHRLMSFQSQEYCASLSWFVMVCSMFFIEIDKIHSELTQISI